MRAQLVVDGFLAKVPRLTAEKAVALLAAMLGAVVALGLAASAASATTFSNNSGITINTSNEDCTGRVATAPAKANPYPSEIAVSGLSSSISDVNVTVSGLSHGYPDDVGLLLVSPAGQSTILMTDSGGGGAGEAASGINLTFDDAASGYLPDQSKLSSGTYKPSVGTTVLQCSAPGSFPDAPVGPYGSALSVFNGSDPNGTWKLYVIDDAAIDAGTISGWSLVINNRAPTSVDDPVTIAQNSVFNRIEVLSNDTDDDGDALRVSSFDATSAQGGTVSEITNGSFNYVPAANFNGKDSFTYTVSDGNGGTATATVNITVTPTVTPVDEAPRVISTFPRDGGEVGPAASIRATFSEDMQEASVLSAFKLYKKGSTNQIAATVTYDAATDTATLNPTNNLRRGATYKAVVTTQAKDEAGNRLDQNSSKAGLQQKVWFFEVDN